MEDANFIAGDEGKSSQISNESKSEVIANNQKAMIFTTLIEKGVRIFFLTHCYITAESMINPGLKVIMLVIRDVRNGTGIKNCFGNNFFSDDLDRQDIHKSQLKT